MNPHSEDCRKMVEEIDRKLEVVMKALCTGTITDTGKDAANTWHQRGQVAALKELRKLITIKEE